MKKQIVLNADMNLLVFDVQQRYGSVTNYCKKRGISRVRFYQIIKAQKGPSYIKLLEDIK